MKQLKTQSEGRIPLAAAAQKLGVSWHVAWARMLQGDLDGRKLKGRWMITTVSVERVRQASSDPSAAA